MPTALRRKWIAPILAAVVSGAVAGARHNAGLPAGSKVEVRLLNELDTGDAQAGQRFSATVASPVVVDGRTVLARDTEMTGRVVEAVSSGRLKRPASIALELTQAGGDSITTEQLRIDGKSHLLRNVAIIGGESAAGAIMGGATAGKKGAAIGAAIGGGAGTATAYLTGKKEIVLPVETRLTFVVASSTSMPASIRPAQNAQPGSAREGPYFSERDRRLIYRYFVMNTRNLPPGLAKRGGKLPPGLERHLERDGTLPPGLQKRFERFPEELEIKLPRLPAGYARGTLASYALILDSNSQIIDRISIRGDQDEQGEDEDEN